MKGGGDPVLRALALFWGCVIVGVGGLAGALQYLGPLPKPAAAHVEPAPLVVAAPVAAVHEAPAPVVVVGPLPPGAAIAAVDPALLEAAPAFPDRTLPRIGPDGRTPGARYAAGWDPADKRPRIAILLADVGMNAQDSGEAIRGLPAAVSFAIPPYGVRAGGLLEDARARGHELFAVVPMEPSLYPQNDPGPQALLTGAAPAENARRLQWALSRFEGYAGVTAVLGRMHGERFANAPELHAVMLEELARRGLLYLDPRPGGQPPRSAHLPPYRAIDLVVDAPPVRSEVDERLGQLERIARETGAAIGLADSPAPMIVDRIAAWATSLPVRGYVLVPVSAIIATPR